MTREHQLLHYKAINLLADAEHYQNEYKWWANEHKTIDNSDLKAWAEERANDFAAKRLETLGQYADLLKQLVEPAMPAE